MDLVLGWGVSYSYGVAPVRAANPPCRVEVVSACAVHVVGMGFWFVVGCVGLLVGRGSSFGAEERFGTYLRDRFGGGKLLKLLRSEDMTVWLCLVPVAAVV